MHGPVAAYPGAVEQGVAGHRLDFDVDADRREIGPDELRHVAAVGCCACV